MTIRRHSTACDRCGETVTFAYGAEPRYCETCAAEKRLREARKR